VGWLLLAIAIVFAAREAGASYVAEPANPGRVAVAWVTSGTTSVWFPLALVFLPLLFPHGRPPSPRWRVVLWLGAAGMVLGVSASAITPGPLALRQGSEIENPLGVAGGAAEAASLLSTVLGAVAVVLAAASVVVRVRRARGAERQQLKWFAYTGVLTAACLFTAVLVGTVIGDGASAGFSAIAVVAWLSGLVLLALGLPAATGIAILKYRLYDIDVVIRRTLVYGGLTALLLGAYLGSVLVLQLVLSPG
jgi:hypothetical protein